MIPTDTAATQPVRGPPGGGPRGRRGAAPAARGAEAPPVGGGGGAAGGARVGARGGGGDVGPGGGGGGGAAGGREHVAAQRDGFPPHRPIVDPAPQRSPDQPAVLGGAPADPSLHGLPVRAGVGRG